MRRLPRIYARRALRWLKLHILHINDSPARIARGVAIGIFIAWTPMIGFHIVMTLAASFLLRANKVAALVAIWINNPFTIVPMFYPGYRLGHRIVGVVRPEAASSMADMKELIERFTSARDFLTNFHRLDFWHEVLDLLVKIGVELWIGCLILGTIAAVLGYFAAYGFVIWHRQKKAHGPYLVE
jgi:uncharacterized protein (DUF2062 family)